jgi:hypothetical protein
MADKIVTEQPKYSEELLDATEKTLRAHDLRCKVGIDISNVLDTLIANGVTPEASNGYLSTSMSGQPAHVNKVFEGLAAQRTELFFPREVGGVASRDQLDQAGKLKFIREQGFDKWEKLPQTAPKITTVVLDRNKLTKAEYLSLDRTTRAQLSGQWGDAAIGRIMSRK